MGMKASFKFRIRQYLAGSSDPLFVGFHMVGEQTMEKESGLAHAKRGNVTIESMEYKLPTDVSEFVIRPEPLGLWDLWIDSSRR